MTIRSDLRQLLSHDGFGRLLSVRLVSQCGDGLFQVGMASLFFFNPTQMVDVGGVALAFTILLLPFSIVGPFVGPLLDRWSRQRVLLIGNTIRSVACLALAWLILTDAHILLISVLALLTLGINRFLLSALSAGLPHVVPPGKLLMANSITPTLGAIATGFGAIVGIIVNRLAPEGPVRDAVSLGAAALLLLVACWAASLIGRTELGPDTPGRGGSVVRKAMADLVSGWRYVGQRGTPARALVVMASHRFLYATNVIALLLMSRNLLADPMDVEAGLAFFALLGGISFVGNALAIVATPIAHQRMSPAAWICVCLGLSVISQALLIFPPAVPLLSVSAVLLGCGVQGAKIAVDTIVQRDTADEYRGRAFALYDMGFNLAFVGAAALGVVLLPNTGWSPFLFLGMCCAYVVLAWWFWRGPHVPRPV